MEVTFEYPEDANKVAVVGEFADWEPLEMNKAKKGDNPFRLKVRLPKEGQYQFRYLVDQEEWVNDDEADDYWPNEFGEHNSVVSTHEN